MDTLQNMRSFVLVAERGSFTAAARELDLTTGVMSRAVTELENHLRARLMNRSTRRLALTTVGQVYFERCRKILEFIESAEDEASGAIEHPTGSLRLHSFSCLGQRYILPTIADYRALHPDVSVELSVSQRMPDLYDGGHDVSIVTAATLPSSELIALPLGEVFGVLCASPRYLRERGTPRVPSDLLHHDCLILQTPSFSSREWRLEGPNGPETIEVNGSLQVNIADLLATGIQNGMGIGMLPVYAAIEGLKNGSLTRVLPTYIVRTENIYVIYPSRRFVDAKVRTWVAFLRGTIPGLVDRDKSLLNGGAKGSQIDNQHALGLRLITQAQSA
ncbi:LysR family transcriptional regulator [Paraburkholderia sp. LEh10]|uniref:LysR family transcriptional regulator n=1 Tax=Paraburkholderia sp. LEh10 TaxID=2821353 RepID=UPI001AE4DC15|nr:LysR family transcriptional regulator [Paraburkholderia sp. LEh10]